MSRFKPIRAELVATSRLAAPVAITQLGMMLMGVVDLAMVGALGAEEIAAIAVGNAIYLLPAIAALGAIMALDAMIAQAVGRGDRARTGELLWQGLWLAAGLGVAMTLLFLDARWLFVALQQEPRVAELAAEYVATRGFGAVAFLAFGAARAFLNGYGHMRPVLAIAVLANVVNGVADWALIYGHLGLPSLGVRGAGIATAVVRWFMLACVVIPLLSTEYRALIVRWRPPRRADVGRILAIGVPLGAYQTVEMGVFSAVAVMSGWLGAVAQAAHQISMTLAALSYHVAVGVAIAASVRVGQAIGRGDLDGAALSGRVALAVGTAWMTVTAALFVGLPEPLVSLFSKDPAVTDIAVRLMWIAAVFQISDGLQCVAGGALRGAGDTKSSLYASIAAHWVIGLPLAWWLAFRVGWGVDGLWWGVTASLTAAGLVLVRRFASGRWKAIGVIA